MTFVQPIYLWGLLTLSIPIAIHLWSRKKVQIVRVGSTQYITETKSKQTNSLKINEWWLLLLRCLIICTLVFILAEPLLLRTPHQEAIVYIFEPSLLATEEGRDRFQNIPDSNRLLLQDGFPEWDTQDYLATSIPNYWQLASEMDALPADSIVVFTQALVKGFRGKRPELKNHITWIPVNLNNNDIKPLFASFKNDSIQVTSVRSDDEVFAFAKADYPKGAFTFNHTNDSLLLKKGDRSTSFPLRVTEPIEVTIIYELNLESQLKFFEIAFRAISKYTDQSIEVTRKPFTDTLSIKNNSHLVWLSPREVPKHVGRILRYQQDEYADRLIVSGKSPTHFILTEEITAQVAFEKPWLDQLVQWLALDQDLQDNLDQLDQRVLPIEEVQNNYKTVDDPKEKVLSSTFLKWLWAVLFVLICGERFLSQTRDQ